MASIKQIVHPRAPEDSSHNLSRGRDAIGIGKGCGLLLLANLLAIGAIIGHAETSLVSIDLVT